MSFSIALHLLAAVIWVGGMIFAHNSLRPAAVQVLEPPLRLELWVQVFRRFFLLVWISIAVILASGYWMLFNYFGGFAGAGTHIHIMHGAGLAMVAIYLHVFFSPYRRLKQAVIVQDYPLAGAQLNQIRKMVGLNILIGILVIVVASAGRYL
ncbi:Phosphoribosylcarboxyaminoimidazole (NCAIR) mutase [hydrothermal vent metagenome]|uniref:Phosphoribosylcarboxyaminoimidazole (NCAIR) mutase n=1 Tax=hydrothermal vent metagenome TaxID=652676 RepID=A0A3B0WG54_9ZZZZ